MHTSAMSRRATPVTRAVAPVPFEVALLSASGWRRRLERLRAANTAPSAPQPLPRVGAIDLRAPEARAALQFALDAGCTPAEVATQVQRLRRLLLHPPSSRRRRRNAWCRFVTRLGAAPHATALTLLLAIMSARV